MSSYYDWPHIKYSFYPFGYSVSYYAQLVDGVGKSVPPSIYGRCSIDPNSGKVFNGCTPPFVGVKSNLYGQCTCLNPKTLEHGCYDVAGGVCSSPPSLATFNV